MMTREEYDSVLKQIADGVETVELMGLIERLRDDFDERENPVDTAAAEEQATADPANDEEIGDAVEEKMTEDWKGKYETLRRDYIDRFFEGKSDAVIENTEEDVKRDGTVQTYDELFKSRVG